MKKIVLLLIFLLALTVTSAFAGKGFPTKLAVFTLGEDIKNYKQYCDMTQTNSMSDSPFLDEVLIKRDSLPGVRGGSLNYGNCANKNKLVRIKIKFNDRSQKFFNVLLDEYTDKFGKPDNYQGDAFKNVIAWEWLFKNNRNEEVSVLLMWSRDKEIRPGVSIKMTNLTLLEKEFVCFKNKDYEFEKGEGTKIKSLEAYIPR